MKKIYLLFISTLLIRSLIILNFSTVLITCSDRPTKKSGWFTSRPKTTRSESFAKEAQDYFLKQEKIYQELYRAIRANNVESIDEIITRYRIDLNSIPTNEQATPLFTAAVNGYDRIVELLLRNGADINKARISDGATPLFPAAANGYDGIVELLLRRGADINKALTSDGATPLMVAAYRGHLQVVKLLLRHRADPNKALTLDGATPLFLAAEKGHLRVVELLLMGGADINQALTSNGSTPLMTAAQEGHLQVVKLLLEYGADINKARTSDGATALQIAYQFSNYNIVKTLEFHNKKRNVILLPASEQSTDLDRRIRDSYQRFLQNSPNELARIIFQTDIDQIAPALSRTFTFDLLLLLLIYLDETNDENSKKTIENIINKVTQNLNTIKNIRIPDDAQCLICMETYEELKNKKTELIPIQHTDSSGKPTAFFCTDCLIAMFNSESNRKCPICQGPLHTLFND